MQHIIRIAVLGFFFLLMFSFSFPREFSIEKLCNQVNTKDYDEISPVVTPDGKTIYFTRVAYPVFNKQLVIDGEDVSKYPSENFYHEQLSWVYGQIAGKEVTDPVGSKFNQDIWISEAKDGLFQEAHSMPSPLNNALPNSVCAVLKDGNQLIVMNQFDPNGGMTPGFSHVNKLENGQWGYPEPLDVEGFDQEGGEVGMFVNDEGTWMLLSMSDETSVGDNDIYISKKIGKNKWSKPINLGKISIQSIVKSHPIYQKIFKRYTLHQIDQEG